MTIETNAFSTYSAVGVREDLSDIIKNISPVDTLFYSSLSEGGATQKKVEWQTDALAAHGDNAHLEGDAETPDETTATARVDNMCQIQKKSLRITNTTEASKSAGGANKLNYLTAKRAKELSKDVEYAFLNGTKAVGAADAARQMRGFVKWITTNTSCAADGSINATTGVLTGGTARQLTEAIFKALLQTIWAAGGNPTQILTTGIQKQKISEWANTGNYRTTVDEKKLNTAVDVYLSDFGAVSIKPHRHICGTSETQDRLIIIDPTHKGRKATLRNTHREKLAITGDSQAWVIRIEHCLRDLTELAHGRIENLSRT